MIWSKAQQVPCILAEDDQWVKPAEAILPSPAFSFPSGSGRPLISGELLQLAAGLVYVSQDVISGSNATGTSSLRTIQVMEQLGVKTFTGRYLVACLTHSTAPGILKDESVEWLRALYGCLTDQGQELSQELWENLQGASIFRLAPEQGDLQVSVRMCQPGSLVIWDSETFDQQGELLPMFCKLLRSGQGAASSGSRPELMFLHPSTCGGVAIQQMLSTRFNIRKVAAGRLAKVIVDSYTYAASTGATAGAHEDRMQHFAFMLR